MVKQQLVLSMVLVDKRILAGGLSMIIVGTILMIIISSMTPAGQSGMTEEEIVDLLIAQQENQDYSTLAGMLIGIGFLLVLISFGARRKKDSAKRKEKKPAK